MHRYDLVSCHDCGVLHRKRPAASRQRARCRRCASVLYRGTSADRGRVGLNRMAAITLAALLTYFIAQFFPIVELQVNGSSSSATLLQAIGILWSERMEVIAAMVFAFTILFPVVELGALLYLVSGLQAGRRRPGFNRLLRLIQSLRYWGMTEVLLIGILITVIKMTSLAIVLVQPGMFGFGALTVLLAIVVRYEPRALWNLADRFDRLTRLEEAQERRLEGDGGVDAVGSAGAVPDKRGAVDADAGVDDGVVRDFAAMRYRPLASRAPAPPPARASTENYARARAALPFPSPSSSPRARPRYRPDRSLVTCHACGLVNSIASGQPASHARCSRCHARLHWRRPDSIARTWALMIAAAILYIPANLLPVMYTDTLFGRENDTILSGVALFWNSGSQGLAVIIFIASIVVPMAKLAALTVLAWTAQRGSTWKPQQRTSLYRMVEFVGRWSMLDIFVITLTVALVRFQTLAVITAGPGALAFGAVVVLTMLASLQFDPRLIWDPVDSPGEKHV